ncbi:MAG: hypothetical protein RJA63_3196 [Pseudomonadota bacterium]
MTIELNKDARLAALNSLQRYATANFEEPIGTLQAGALLDFVLQEIGPSIYNQAIADAQGAMLARVTELDIDCHEDEFPYWTKRARKP